MIQQNIAIVGNKSRMYHREKLGLEFITNPLAKESAIKEM